MKNGTCPKCNSTNVFKKTKGVSFGSYPIRVNTGTMMVGGTEFDSYVCVDCGYFENYIQDPVKLQEGKTKWTKV